MITAETTTVNRTAPATVREQGRPVARWYVQPIACYGAWAAAPAWSACIACHLDGAPVLLPDGVAIEGVNPRHLHILMVETWPECERCECVNGEWVVI